jgi:hypothetical protein
MFNLQIKALLLIVLPLWRNKYVYIAIERARRGRGEREFCTINTLNGGP